MDAVYSVNAVPIRLTDERWMHIASNKPYMETYYEKVLEAVENPDWILRGYAGAVVAVMSVARRRYLNVVYREVSRDDRFIITAFVSRRVNGRMIIWPRRF